jgi:hypothetical protein
LSGAIVRASLAVLSAARHVVRVEALDARGHHVRDARDGGPRERSVIGQKHRRSCRRGLVLEERVLRKHQLHLRGGNAVDALDLRGDVALEAALEGHPLLEVGRAESQARHVGAAVHDLVGDAGRGERLRDPVRVGGVQIRLDGRVARLGGVAPQEVAGDRDQEERDHERELAAWFDVAPGIAH